MILADAQRPAATDLAADRTAGRPGDLHLLQALAFPEPGICTEAELYMRLSGPAALDLPGRAVEFAAGGRARFDTWFNLFNIGKWRRAAGLEDLRLILRGEGRFGLTVSLSLPGRSSERLAIRTLTLSQEGCAVDLSHFAEHGDEGVVHFELVALGSGRLSAAEWRTAAPPLRTPALMLSVTTFRREAAVARTARRFADFAAASPLGEHMHMLIVDNGQSARIDDSPHVSRVDNANLGGAGGFARGQIEAGARGYTHCLFMDDDAAIHMDSLERTWRMLAYARAPATAVAGAMIDAGHRWAIWENGAVFDTRCWPCHMGTDLREFRQVAKMEFATTRRAGDRFYGGWWFFAFPLAEARHLPFPFFVRGDDVSFSLVHDFDILTLPGVASFQDDFTGKESPLTWYLDLRSHLVHHLALPRMEIGPLRTARIALWFAARCALRMHYDSLSAVNLAIEDVLEGPDFFARNADMAARRADLKALTQDEAWHPLDGAPPPERRRLDPDRWLPRTLMKLSLNGLLLPGFARWGDRITLEAAERGAVRPVWGAARITYLDGGRRNAYTVRHSKARAGAEGLRLARNLRRLVRSYGELRDTYRASYARLTAREFWDGALGLAGERKDKGQDRP